MSRTIGILPLNILDSLESGYLNKQIFQFLYPEYTTMIEKLQKLLLVHVFMSIVHVLVGIEIFLIG